MSDSSDSESNHHSHHSRKRKRERPNWYVNTCTSSDIMTINVIGKVNLKMTEAIFKALDQAIEKKVEKVIFYVTSHGGHSDAGYAIYNQLKVYKSAFKIVTIGIGEMSSSAIDILLASDERYCTTDCNIVVHGISYADKNVEKLWNERMIKVFSKRTGKKIKYWKERMLTGDHTYTAEEAIDAGLIHNVIELNPTDH